jgi:8-oxo-dGTP pyrophosphatase MutT (NUDIX family)
MAFSGAIRNLFAAFFESRTQSAGGVVVGKDGKILVVNQKGRSWSLPKGHIDGNEMPLETARREIYEETGIEKLEFIKELGCYTRHKIGKEQGTEDTRELKTITIFLFRTDETRTIPIEEDSWDTKWLLPEHAVECITHPKDKEFLKEHLSDISEIPEH